jgi:hypothetical protein
LVDATQMMQNECTAAFNGNQHSSPTTIQFTDLSVTTTLKQEMNKPELQGLHHSQHLTKHGRDQSRLEGLQE